MKTSRNIIATSANASQTEITREGSFMSKAYQNLNFAIDSLIREKGKADQNCYYLDFNNLPFFDQHALAGLLLKTKIIDRCEHDWLSESDNLDKVMGALASYLIDDRDDLQQNFVETIINDFMSIHERELQDRISERCTYLFDRDNVSRGRYPHLCPVNGEVRYY